MPDPASPAKRPNRQMQFLIIFAMADYPESPLRYQMATYLFVLEGMALLMVVHSGKY
jgi:hypothetical protein